jgi:hypothetical protein
MATITIAGRTLDVREAKTLTVGEMRKIVFPWRARVRALQDPEATKAEDFAQRSMELAVEGLGFYLGTGPEAVAAVEALPMPDLWPTLSEVQLLSVGDKEIGQGEAQRP